MQVLSAPRRQAIFSVEDSSASTIDNDNRLLENGVPLEITIMIIPVDLSRAVPRTHSVRERSRFLTAHTYVYDGTPAKQST